METDVSGILKAIGPAASMIFAAWIFVGFLQQRYDSTVARYKQFIEQYRTDDIADPRRANIKDQILVLKRRCELMSRANTLGLASAILLIISLMAGELNIMFPSLSTLKYITVGSSLLGFTLVIVGTTFLIVEGRVTRRQLGTELLDVPDLANSTGQEAGKVPEQKRDPGEPGRRSAA